MAATTEKAAKKTTWLFLGPSVELVRETEKAVLLRRWIGMGVDPTVNARQQWFPKKVVRKVTFNGLYSGTNIPTQSGRYWQCKAWFVGKEKLWAWLQG